LRTVPAPDQAGSTEKPLAITEANITWPLVGP
jgi:hypothetical protein